MDTAFVPGPPPFALLLERATRWQEFVLVQVPLARPAIMSLTILLFLWTWNRFLLPVVLVQDPMQRTMAGALGTFQRQWGTNIPLLSPGRSSSHPDRSAIPYLPAPPSCRAPSKG